MRAHTWPASFSALNVASVYSRVSTAFSPATTWKHSWSNVTPRYVKRIDSSLPGRRPRMRNSSDLLICVYLRSSADHRFSLTLGKPPALHALGERLQQRGRLVPTEAGIRDRHAIGERLPGHEVLAPGIQVALHHHPHDALVALRDLARHVGAYFHLLLVLLRRVRVREVDHEVGRE